MTEETKNQLNMVLAAVSILALATATFWWTNSDPQPVADALPGPTTSETVTVTLSGSTATVTATKTVRATRTVTVTPKPSPKPTATPEPTPEPAPVQKTSRDREETPSGFSEWLNSPTARLVIHRESRGSCTAVNPSGKYRGKWQADASFWSSYGGLEYAPTPDQATCHQQDLVAYRGWLARGWQPWPTAQ